MNVQEILIHKRSVALEAAIIRDAKYTDASLEKLSDRKSAGIRELAAKLRGIITKPFVRRPSVAKSIKATQTQVAEALLTQVPQPPVGRAAAGAGNHR